MAKPDMTRMIATETTNSSMLKPWTLLAEPVES
jgi:hypothetical protein